jgi:hypothetical protein
MVSLLPTKFHEILFSSITNPLILEEQNSFKIIGTWAEQFSGMGNFAKTIWNSTCNPCFSTFDQFFPQRRMSPPVPQTVVIGKKSIWVTNKIKLQ